MARGVAAGLAAVAAGLPGAAAAHGVGERYDLPAPLAHFIIGATATVALSFLVTALVAGGRASVARRRGLVLPLGGIGRWLRGLARLVGVGLLLLAIWAGLAGDQHPVRNIAPTLVWVGWWIGLSFVVALAGDIWPALDPWRSLYDAADALARRVAGRRLTLALAYPRRLGLWPAGLLLLVFAWCELVWSEASLPRSLAILALGWTAFTFAGMVCLGADTWQSRADPFARYFATLGRFAPLIAEPGGHGLRVRPLGRGLLDPVPPAPGRAAFVIAMLATVLFDGLLGTRLWRLLEGALDASPMRALDREGTVLATVGLLGVWLALLAAYGMAWRLTRRLVGADAALSLGPRIALTLVPIAVAYHVAHNLGYLLVRGQELIPLASDPLGRDWDLFGTAAWTPNVALVGARFEWYVAVGAVVAGHVMSIWLAHRLMLHVVPAPRRAALAALPLTALMVGYTALSLSVIADPLVRDPTSSGLPDAHAGDPDTTVGSAVARPAGKGARPEPAKTVVGAADAGMDDAGIVERHQHEQRQLRALRRRLGGAIAGDQQQDGEQERSEPPHRRTS